MRGLVVAALLAAGCNGSSEPLLFQSGQRLRAQVLVGEDGSRFLRGWGWVDTELGFDCYPAEVDGRLRCAPTDAAELSYFADASCTEPAALVADALTYVYARLDPECSQGSRSYFQASTLRRGPIYASRTDGCVQVYDGSLVVAGEAVAADTFVGLTTEIVPGGGRVQARIWRSDDGAWSVVGGYDRDRRVAVIPFSLGELPGWVPEAAIYSFSRFGDASCTRLVAPLHDGCEPPKAIWTYEQVDGCGQYRMWEVGEPRAPDAPIYHSLQDGECTASDEFQPSYELGAPLAPLPATVTTVGGARLRSDAFVANDHALAMGSLRDTVLGASCDIAMAADGRERCLPGRFEASHFRDAACMQPIAWVGSEVGCSPAQALYAYLPDDERRVFRLAQDSFTTPMVYLRDEAACRPTDGSGSRWAHVEDEVPAADFIPVALVIE